MGKFIETITVFLPFIIMEQESYNPYSFRYGVKLSLIVLSPIL